MAPSGQDPSLADAETTDSARWLVDAADATDHKLCGGKAVGLGRLVRADFPVPPTICVTTAFYREGLAATDVAARVTALSADSTTQDPDIRHNRLAELRHLMETAPVSDAMVLALRDGVDRIRQSGSGTIIVRSSTVDEDGGDASYASIHTSIVVHERDAGVLLAAIKTCWASLWTEAAWRYRERVGSPHALAAMAIVVQPFIRADRAGVAFSVDPLTGDRETIVIEAARGAAAALVSGRITPDTYRVSVNDVATVDGGRPPGMRPGRDRLRTTLAAAGSPMLSQPQVLELARLAKAVERALGTPTDIEWAFDGQTFWVVQARPITASPASPAASMERGTLWTRANLKEVFPELPSPLTLSYLSIALDRMFASYHTSQGFTLPPGARLVRMFHGRPYLNLTLMHTMTLARGGDPSVVARLFGGASGAPAPPETTNRGSRVTIGAGVRLAREMLATFFRTPRRGRRLFRRMLRQARVLRSLALDRLDDAALIAHLESFLTTLLHETTMRRLHEVVSAQSRAYMALEGLLAAWVGADADSLVKRLMTGLGTLPNAQMTYRLMEIGALAASEPRTHAFFAGELDESAARGYRTTLAGTRCLTQLNRFLEDFGHRGPYESDIMSARFCEDPTPVLRLIRLHTRAEARVDPVRHLAERHLVRREAKDDVRRALRRGRSRLAFAARWGVFTIACDALQRLLALRDECRHVTTFMVAHLRRVVREIGRRATRDGLLATPEDVFFVSLNELPRVLMERRVDWRGLTGDRRLDRSRDECLEVPDLLRDEESADGPPGEFEIGEDLVGFGVSPGIVTGTVQVLRSAEDLRHLRGDIVVFPTIEPTLTPIFPLVRGLVAEMGGLLSHAAILAREYGLPAVVNVRDATRRLRDGDRIQLDGTTGRLRMLERSTNVPVAANAGAGVNVLDESARSPHLGSASGTSPLGETATVSRS